jgi:hypothetical protein
VALDSVPSTALLIFFFVNRVLQQVKQEVRQQQEQMAQFHPSDSSVRPSAEPAGSFQVYKLAGGFLGRHIPNLIEDEPCS